LGYIEEEDEETGRFRFSTPNWLFSLSSNLDLNDGREMDGERE
jgi:hypothetical protein